MSKTNIYHLEGLTCVNCAQKFEQNIRALDSVQNVELNFTASKVSITGNVTLEQLEQAGAFDNIKVIPDKQTVVYKQPLWKKRENQTLFIAFIILIASLITQFFYGKNHFIPIALYIVTISVGGYHLFIAGIRHLFTLYFDMKTLMTIAIIGAAIIGEWMEAAIVVFLFALSEALEAYAMNRARLSIQQLMAIAPNKATIVKNNELIEMDVENVVVGDMMIVRPGEKLALDGEIIEGETAINEAAITGESLPAVKTVGDTVFAGTLNETGSIRVKVTKLVEDTTLAKIIHLVEKAQTKKAPAQQFVDQFAKYYTPFIMILALFVAILPPLIVGAAWSKWIYLGLATLVVGCPCALIISTPVAIVTAIGNAARQGILIKGGAYLEEVGRIKAIAFDKTGTLTVGKPAVTEIIPFTGSKDELLQLAASVENLSEHPLARAIVHKAHDRKLPLEEAYNFKAEVGKGASAYIDDTKYFIGNRDYIAAYFTLEASAMKTIIELQKKGRTVMIVGTVSKPLGIIAVADEIREEAKDVIRSFDDKEIFMLTGDDAATAHAYASEIGIANVRANLLPEQKLTIIDDLQEEYGTVAMVGDGINDAPALATASVGIAMGANGTDVALETADVVIMDDDLKKLPRVIRLSKKAVRIVQQNIMFSFGLKLLALALVIPNLLTLWIAIIADVGATLIVILNAMRLMKTIE